MRRRHILGVVGGAAAWPVAAQAQKPALRIGFLYSGAAKPFVALSRSRAIREGLRDNGLIDGRDYIIEARFAAGHYGSGFPNWRRNLRKPELCDSHKYHCLCARCAAKLVPPVPIVMPPINHPVGAGLISNLARPGVIQLGWRP